MSGDELTAFEWRVIDRLLPSKPRGVLGVNGRRALNGNTLDIALRFAMAGFAGMQRSVHDTL